MPISRAEQRRLVWAGKLRKTTGGLTRDDLMLNRTGRIVSKRKSQAASKVNNLGNWLRVSGTKFSEKPAAAKKGSNGKAAAEPKKVAAKKVVPKKVVPKKVAPKKVAPKKVKPPKKKKLDSKSTVVALKKKAEAGAAKNSKAGPPLSKTKAPEVIAKKASKKSEKEIQKEIDQIGLDVFGF